MHDGTPLARDNRGNQLVSLIKGEEGELLCDPKHAPLPLALVIARGPSGFMLLKNRYRGQWELPGGMIEPGETPAQCAAREFHEESGCTAGSTHFLGLALFDLMPDYFNASRRRECAAVYGVEVSEYVPFASNDEMTDRMWYEPGDVVENASPLDLRLVDLFAGWDIDIT